MLLAFPIVVFLLMIVAILGNMWLKRKRPKQEQRIRYVGTVLISGILLGMIVLFEFILLEARRGGIMGLDVLFDFFIMVLLVPILLLLGRLTYKTNLGYFKYLVILSQLYVLSHLLYMESIYYYSERSKDFYTTHMEDLYRADIGNVIVVGGILVVLILWFLVDRKDVWVKWLVGRIPFPFLRNLIESFLY